MQPYAFPVCGAYAIVFTADRPNLGSSIAAKVGDCSYGLYLYGWPAEQMVKQLTSTNNPWLLFIMSVPLAFAFALISCHLVERPAIARAASASHVSDPRWGACARLVDRQSSARRWHSSWGWPCCCRRERSGGTSWKV
jgi:peptidoglycan/LPS O-acetylase OafA/YrhL